MVTTSSLAGRMDQLGEAGRHCVVAHGRAGADHLGGDLAGGASLADGSESSVADVVAAVAHPVRHEEVLAVARDRAAASGVMTSTHGA